MTTGAEMSNHSTAGGLLERLQKGPVVCAEGYLVEFERRGYLQAGAFVPEIALEAIKAAGLPAVVTLAIHQAEATRDGLSPEDACRRLADAGADVVGLNCIRGPRTMLPLIARIRGAVDTHVAALPVPYRTTPEQPSFQSLRDPSCDCLPGDRPFPTALDPFTCNRFELAAFARSAQRIGVNYLGVCCGAGAHHIRSVAEALGRTPPASRFSPDM